MQSIRICLTVALSDYRMVHWPNRVPWQGGSVEGKKQGRGLAGLHYLKCLSGKFKSDTL
jgi:hypothetical protein